MCGLGGICPEHFQLDQIQNGRLGPLSLKWAIIIAFNTCKNVPDSSTVTIEQNVRVEGGMCSKKIQLDQLQNDRHVAIIDFNMRTIWKYLCRMTNLK